MRLAVVVAVTFAFAVSPAGAVAPLRGFDYHATGTNVVRIRSGQLREVWRGRAGALGAITAHVSGTIQIRAHRRFAIQATIVIAQESSRDKLIGGCRGTGILPEPSGSEDWACDDRGGTGRFSRSRGAWRLHIAIHRVTLENGLQRNRFTETAHGRISWRAGRR